MEFSNTSTKQGIVQDASFLIFGDSGDHSSDYPLADVARNANRWGDKAVAKVLQSDHDWEWDDNNKTDLPIANINLVANQQNYGVSGATYLKIKKVDIKDSSGNNVSLAQFGLDDLRGTADADYQSTAGVPRFYRLQANTIFLYPKPDYSYTSGLRIFYQRNQDYFAGTDTTKTPGIAEPFHRIWSLGAAYEYALMAGMSEKMAMFRQELAQLMADLEDFYASRNNDKVSFSLAGNDYGQGALGGSASSQNGFNI